MAVSLLRSIHLPNAPDLKPYTPSTNIESMVYLIQQLILTDYVSMFAGTLMQNGSTNKYSVAAPLLLSEYRRQLEQQADTIPHPEFKTGTFMTVYKVMSSLAQGDMPSADDIMDVFMLAEVADNTRLSIPKEFLLPFIYSINGTSLDKERLFQNVSQDNEDEDTESGTSPNSYKFYRPLIYTPVFVVEDHRLYLKLEADSAFQMTAFSVSDYFDLRNNMALPYRYLASFNWRGKSFTTLIGLLERFSIEHDSHVMQNNGICTVGDICHDIVTESDYCRSCKPSNITSFVALLKYISDKYRVFVDDCAYLGDILKKSGIGDPHLIGFLQKNEDEVTVAEMEAFTSSVFASFVHKTVRATEASDRPEDDEDEKKDKKDDAGSEPEDASGVEDDGTSGDDGAGTDPNSDTGGEDPNALPGDTDSGGDLGGGTDDPMALGDDPMGGDGASGGDTPEGESEDTETDKVVRKIPPAADGILLELLNPENETMADYLYRREFSIRVEELLKNPTSSSRYSSQTLFMLKQWATKWLFIFSVQSLKSFLRNINFTTMPKQ